MNLNEDEKKVLGALAECDYGWCDYSYMDFAGLSEQTGLDRKAVRAACRSLKDKGLAQFRNGLWTEDGEPAGSGYSLSDAGKEYAHAEALKAEDDG